MAINKAKFVTKECQGTQYIETKNPVLKIKAGQHKLKFNNKIKNGNDFIDAKIEFYEIATKAGDAPIEKFCENQADEEFLKLDKNKVTKCKPLFTGDYEYVVSALDDTLPVEPLDPVIIIDPSISGGQNLWFSMAPPPPREYGATGAPLPAGGGILPLATTALLSLLVGLLVGKKLL